MNKLYYFVETWSPNPWKLMKNNKLYWFNYKQLVESRNILEHLKVILKYND